MPSFINSNELFEWCRIPAEQLENHPKARFKIQIVPTPDDVPLTARDAGRGPLE
jgi:hypothetical protein